MMRRQIELFRRGLVVVDLCITVLTFVVAYWFRQFLANTLNIPELAPVVDHESYQVLMFALPPIWALSLYLCGTGDFRISYREVAARYARAVSIGLALIITAFFVFKLHTLARSFVVLFGVFNIFGLFFGRYLIMETVTFLRNKRVDGHRMVVVGRGPRAASFARSLRTDPTLNIKLLGHAAILGEVADERASPTLCAIEDLEHLLDNQPVDEVLFAVPSLEDEAVAAALRACDERGVDVLLPLPPALPTMARISIENVEGFDSPLLGLRRTPTGEVRIALKRVIDVAGALVALLLAAPVMIGVALAIRFGSKGPIFFKQTRAGRNGRKFTMYKFRSMVVDAEAKKEALLHLNEMSGPVFKIQRDPRITPIGSLIRRTSLDELPQLFNILFGDMSLVGPRPPLPSEVEHYEPWQRRRLSVKPGLTGLWQVSGRNQIDFDEWMKLDLRYIDNWSLWLDLKILLRTVPAVLFKTGAS